jgi:hypothetical protein
LNYSPILEEVAKKIKTTPEDIKFKKDLAGTSTAQVSEITWNKGEKFGILKQNTTKVEWLFYSKIAKNYKVPAPFPIAFSKSSDVPWILLDKIYRGVHPKKWGRDNIDRALSELAGFHAQFLGREEEKEFSQFPKLLTKDWETTKEKLNSNIDRAINIASQYSEKTPVTKTEFERVKKTINSEGFIEDILFSGTTLLHGATWVYNFMQSKKCSYLLDWRECHFGAPATEILHFYDLFPFSVEGIFDIKISLREQVYTLDEIIKIYITAIRKNEGKILIKDFKKSIKASVAFHIAHHWAPILKPDVIYLHGGRYFVARTLRLLPSRRVMREHFKNLLAIGK